MYDVVLSLELEKLISKLAKKDRQLVLALNNKIKQICSCDDELINHYKNLKGDLSDYKRVHIDKSFVLLFKVNRERNTIYFDRLQHHDNVYK